MVVMDPNLRRLEAKLMCLKQRRRGLRLKQVIEETNLSLLDRQVEAISIRTIQLKQHISAYKASGERQRFLRRAQRESLERTGDPIFRFHLRELNAQRRLQRDLRHEWLRNGSAGSKIQLDRCLIRMSQKSIILHNLELDRLGRIVWRLNRQKTDEPWNSTYLAQKILDRCRRVKLVQAKITHHVNRIQRLSGEIKIISKMLAGPQEAALTVGATFQNETATLQAAETVKTF